MTGITIVHGGEDRASLKRKYPAASVYVLESGDSPSEETFFAAAELHLPLDPPLGPGRKWDALGDSLFEGLLDLGSDHVVIHWNDAAAMRSADPQTFELACAVLGDVADQLGDPALTVEKEIRLDVHVRLPQ